MEVFLINLDLSDFSLPVRELDYSDEKFPFIADGKLRVLYNRMTIAMQIDICCCVASEFFTVYSVVTSRCHSVGLHCLCRLGIRVSPEGGVYSQF